jgi:mRNA interferase MazF
VVIRRGDVFWIEDGGRRRPAAVLTRDSAIPLLNRVVVAPATRTIRDAPTEVRLGPADGMPDECVLSIDNIRVVPKKSLKRRITTLEPARLEEACDAIAYSLGC